MVNTSTGLSQIIIVTILMYRKLVLQIESPYSVYKLILLVKFFCVCIFLLSQIFTRLYNSKAFRDIWRRSKLLIAAQWYTSCHTVQPFFLYTSLTPGV